MVLRRLRLGEWLAALSGVALLVSLFLPWYDAAVCVVPYDDAIRSGALPCPTLNGWEAMSAIDVLLALVAASGVLLAIVTAAQSVPAVPVALSALVALAGLFGLLLTLLRLLDAPSGAVDRGPGLVLALIGGAGIVLGSVLAMRAEVRPGAARPDIPAMPAPGP
jgi:hypothetical protein